MSTVTILGAGELGGSIAYALARAERVGRVVLIDEGTGAAGKALDIQQSGPIEGFHTRVEGTPDLTRVTGCAVCVVADSGGADLTVGSYEKALAMMARLKGFVGDVPMVFAGAGQADLLLASVREAGFERRRVIGSAPEALASAVRAIAALEARCSPSEVALSVLGAPPSGFVIPWSEASIGGHSLERVLTQVQIRNIEARVARLWPPGPHALGTAAARVVEAIVTSSRRAPGVLTVLGGEFGVRNRAGVLPCLLGPDGIVEVRIPSLNARERVQLETALGA